MRRKKRLASAEEMRCSDDWRSQRELGLGSISVEQKVSMWMIGNGVLDIRQAGRFFFC